MPKEGQYIKFKNFERKINGHLSLLAKDDILFS